MTEWTDVNDGLPEGRNQWGSNWWLVAIPGNIPVRAVFKRGKWTRYAGDLGYAVFVTHWAPLPDLPEKKR